MKHIGAIFIKWKILCKKYFQAGWYRGNYFVPAVLQWAIFDVHCKKDCQKRYNILATFFIGGTKNERLQNTHMQ